MPKKTKKVTKKTIVAKKPAKKPVKKAPKKQPAPVAPPAPPVVVAPAPPPPVKTESEKIWEEIRFLPIEMFGLPGQTVEMHVTPVNVEPTKLYVVTRSPATLPSLEATLLHRFTVELADKFVIIQRVPAPMIPKKR